MTDQLTALKELAEKVEASDDSWMQRWLKVNDAIGGFADHSADLAIAAYNGSLDAAHALHKAVLGIRWVIRITMSHKEHQSQAVHIFIPRQTEDDQPCGFSETATTPARAWLLAIIKAKITELEQ